MTHVGDWAMMPFDARAICPKCGHDDIAARFAETNREIGCDNFEPCQEGMSFFLMEHEAHIHRYCRRCSYKWLEAPIGSKSVGIGQ